MTIIDEDDMLHFVKEEEEAKIAAVGLENKNNNDAGDGGEEKEQKEGEEEFCSRPSPLLMRASSSGLSDVVLSASASDLDLSDVVITTTSPSAAGELDIESNRIINDDDVGVDVYGASPSDAVAVANNGVHFANVEIREYKITIGDNPCCSGGAPVTLDWDYTSKEPISIDSFEAKHPRRRTRKQLLLNYYQRRDLLWRSGHTIDEIKEASKEVDKERFRRSVSLYFQPIFRIEEVITFTASSILDPKKHAAELIHQVRSEHSVTSSHHSRTSQESDDNSSSGIIHHHHNHHKNKDDDAGSICSFEIRNKKRPRLPRGIFHHHDDDDPYLASAGSNFERYAVRVDRAQHDKSMQVVLCNFARPHMRGFHFSWISFFVAFFAWFAITPLLGEVRESLELTNEDIWTSSLCGTAGTIIMRILIGPACDKFGARICMAFVLAAAAIPVGLTGLVNSASGLAISRFFTGIAGASFVACQYWTYSMFTREVAGLANALVAGWGNLGGGIAQLVMGSALFPLFKLFFAAEDNDGDDGMTSSEMAWRTVFIVPALLALVTAVVIVVYSDDSPKGDYRLRVRTQEIMVVSPIQSLCSTAHKRNTVILFIQYACCFGVEVTMTNAAALYYRDQFGQSTVSAAAIASIFGIMNLFARGVGGASSDACYRKFGIRGRIYWQFAVLILEGVAIVIFGFASSLAGSILALVFVSLMVQSAEGSTFGIVPYVDRRFTGSVVGWVGAGGNFGGVIFAIFFREYSYEKAFTLMGITSALSSLLSWILNTHQWNSVTEANYQLASTDDDDEEEEEEEN